MYRFNDSWWRGFSVALTAMVTVAALHRHLYVDAAICGVFLVLWLYTSWDRDREDHDD